MFSITLKRSAATLGVVAGLLAAAAPASAQVMPGVIGVTNRDSAGHTILITAGTADDNMLLTGSKAPATPTANGFGLSFEHIDMNARSNDDQKKDNGRFGRAVEGPPGRIVQLPVTE